MPTFRRTACLLTTSARCQIQSGPMEMVQMYDFILYERSLAGKKMRGADFPPSSADWSRRPDVAEMTGGRRFVRRALRVALLCRRHRRFAAACRRPDAILTLLAFRRNISYICTSKRAGRRVRLYSYFFFRRLRRIFAPLREFFK